MNTYAYSSSATQQKGGASTSPTTDAAISTLSDSVIAAHRFCVTTLNTMPDGAFESADFWNVLFERVEKLSETKSPSLVGVMAKSRALSELVTTADDLAMNPTYCALALSIARDLQK